jgi:hypothetical protein
MKPAFVGARGGVLVRRDRYILLSRYYHAGRTPQGAMRASGKNTKCQTTYTEDRLRAAAKAGIPGTL